MSTPVLIITSDIPFGEHIRQILEETRRYVVRVTGEQGAAAVYARELKPALAFLDTSLAETELLKIGSLLRQVNPQIIFVVISEAGWHSALEELFPRDYLSKPFYAPDLREMMENYFPPSAIPEPTYQTKKGDSSSDLPWLSDVNRAAQHLTRLTLESSAQAAMITRTDQLWAYAGQLPQEAAHELAATLSRYWDHDEENDLVRFVRLASTEAEHMLYATRLAEGMVLALVFDAETPFSTIRTQASQLVHSLSSSPSDETPDDDLGDGELDPSAGADHHPNAPARSPRLDLPVGSGYDFGSSDQAAGKKFNAAVPVQDVGAPQLSRQPSPAARFRQLVDTDQGEPLTASLEETLQSQEVTRKIKTRKPVPAPETVEETAAIPAQEVARKIVLEPVNPAVYNLDYACLLLPRFPQHHMTGDLLDKLGEWVPHICIAFAWRLEYISIRPEHLQWIVNVPPATSPAYLMRILRQHTSERIFAEFPRFKKENPSGDFWAPGYLIMGGSQPPPVQLIKDFITQTRQRQGIIQLNNR
jgi:REP element-mobilizing transposase RayT/DNA-binding NarL/FixJ family response regulator